MSVWLKYRKLRYFLFVMALLEMDCSEKNNIFCKKA